MNVYRATFHLHICPPCADIRKEHRVGHGVSHSELCGRFKPFIAFVSPISSTTENKEKVQRIADMGFDRRRVKLVLQVFDFKENEALDLLLSK